MTTTDPVEVQVGKVYDVVIIGAGPAGESSPVDIIYMLLLSTDTLAVPDFKD